MQKYRDEETDLIQDDSYIKFREDTQKYSKKKHV